jgi:hypothetical protein
MRPWVAAAGLALLALPMACGTPSSSPGGPSPQALADIPAGMLRLYEAVGGTYGVPWQVLAGVGKVESDHGRSSLPGVHSGANFAGAEGPMQLLPATFAEYAVPGHRDIYDPTDAVLAAGRMLAANGATNPATLAHAIFQYNHDVGYVRQVLSWADKYVQALTGPFRPGVPTRITTTVAPLFASTPPGGFPTRSFPFGQCTWYAAYQWGGPRHRGVTWSGNATDWLGNAQAQGFATSLTPAVGAIAVWRAGVHYGVYGHVAVVTAVDQRAFTVSEMNFVGLAEIDSRRISWPDPDLEGFIPA